MERRPVHVRAAGSSAQGDRQGPQQRGGLRSPLIAFLLSALISGLTYSFVFYEDVSPALDVVARREGRSVVEQPKQLRPRDQPPGTAPVEVPEQPVAKPVEAATASPESEAKPPATPEPPVASTSADMSLATVEALGKSLSIVKPSSRTWNVIAGTPWFGGAHPWARGETSCPGGCSINWRHDHGAHEADVLLVHGDAVDRAPEKPYHDKQLIALWASETFDLPSRGAHDYRMFHTEFTTRLGGFMRDPYFADLVDQARPDALKHLKDARTWDDVFEHIVPASERIPLAQGSISFASSHCASRSGRERVITELQTVVPVKVYGSSCQRNVNEAENSMGRLEQWALWRRFKFYLALENHICEGYLTEKALKSLMRGQVPVYLGAPEAAQLLPPGSFIDASAFKTGAELGAFLKHLDEDDVAYAKYHEWRYASFETYPLQFRREVISLVNLLAHFGPGHHAEYMSCLMCYSLQDWAEKNKWDPPRARAFPQGIKPWQCFPAWPDYVPPQAATMAAARAAV